ncbi:inositol monophosphatase family protein [Candidatus Kapabacteria bacterium]|nr:inositol monophosphatase family protein [Candidatus Kapabacteria bacterium]
MLIPYIELAKDSAYKAGKILLEGFGTDFIINNKEGINNLVTEYDTRAEKIIIDNILSHYPNHSFLAEESGYTKADTEYRWIIDPLDGTVNFAHNLPVFSVSIALEKNGEIICGCVYNPVLDQMFHAELGKGAFKGDTKILVSSQDDIHKSFLVTGFPYNISENPKNAIEHFVKVVGSGIPVRRLGSAALDLAYVACGIFDGFWEVYLNPWDVAAGMLILREAGGKMTHYDNTTYKHTGETVVASNGIIHDEILKFIDYK